MSEGTTPWQGLFPMGRKPKCRKFRTNRSGQQSFCISTVPGGQMSEGTTPGKEDDCRDAGGRVTQGAVAELESRRRPTRQGLF